ncbi:acetyl-CoA synthetase [Photobacterium gaetbulicola]|uniref:acetate--CoA ligase n=1 Tax=Photobacterium gaetbulicola TaxID=1295392 RepID=A0A0B9G2I5_9GAMM|nr:acetate--CoA ligase [Photobacterium gaetbulicola]KHT62983.1 acetyl-CoA synthetase [Photobacterium gaetbulicola]
MVKPIFNKVLAENANLVNYAQAKTQPPPRCTQPKGLSSGGLNIGYEAVDRHLGTPFEDKVALRWISKKDQIVDLSYHQLSKQSSAFGSLLTQLGLASGSRIYSLIGRRPELYIAVLGTLKAGCVFTPLFSAFGPEPIRSRMEIGEANVVVTTLSLYQKKLKSWWRELPHLKAILLVDGNPDNEEGCYDFHLLMGCADHQYPTVRTQPEDTALLHFTSGTTGKPKGVRHVHQAVEHHLLSAFYALDLKPTDTYWCTADPGWVTGTTYGIIAPLCLGVTMIVDEAEFDAERWYKILQDQHVTVWYTAPTAIRMLMKAGDTLPSQFDLTALRFMASVGEPLNPEAVEWSNRVLRMPFHDNWWQTETGGIMIANYPSEPIKPGSMGQPLPGIEAAIIIDNEQGQLVEASTPMTIGELAIKAGWPSMFRGYLNQAEKYAQCFSGEWYLSGDLAMKDEDGYFWFVGRKDDLIKSSGHLIGPFEVESVLMEHPAVAEVGVIGIPDPVAGQLVKAFVALKPGVRADDELRQTLLGLARKELGAAVAPKEIAFRTNLPKTRSGKIMRRLLKARELGLPEGDTSTLESDEQ